MDANSDEPWSDLIVSQPSYSGAHHHSRYQNQVALSELQGRWQLRDGTGSVKEASATRRYRPGCRATEQRYEVPPPHGKHGGSLPGPRYRSDASALAQELLR
ncbi:MAG: hypothetical protein WCD60_05570 [Pseudolabrys sp.]